ncbi:TPA: plasmid mobilization protein [Streptococcus suis]
MTNRTRSHQLKIYLTAEELKAFKMKCQQSRSKTMGHFLRKCVLEKNIYVIDMQPFRDIQHLLSKSSVNINQIAKKANTTGLIYKEDIQNIKNELATLSLKVLELQSLLQKRGNHSYGHHKNPSH